MKKLFCFLLFALFLTVNPYISEASENMKIGVMFSKPNEDYADTVHPGGQYKPKNWPHYQTVSPKVDYSSILDKEMKMFHFYSQQGYNVERISHNALNNLDILHQYDAIVFPYTVLMNHKQRENLKTYIYGGGGALFLYGTGRNELDNYPKKGEMDLTPLIYDTLTYIWEWDNLSEVFQSRFMIDLTLSNAVISNNPSVTHPILIESYKELGRNYIKLEDNSTNWYEIVQPWNQSLKPLLQISNYSYSSNPNYMNKNTTGTLYAVEHGEGRVVFSTFKIFDFLHVDAKGVEWEDPTKGAAFNYTSGKEDAEAILKASLNWIGQDATQFTPRKYDVNLSYSNLTANITPQKKFAVRGSITVKNTGNVPARGKLKVDVYDKNNKSLGQYTKLLIGLAPTNTLEQSYTEKFEILLPGTIANGAYTVKATFEEARHDRSGYITRAENYILNKSGNYGSFEQLKMFRDVSTKNSHYHNIRNASKIGIIAGYNDGTFKPGSNVSRLHAMMMLLKALNIPVSSSATLPASVTDLKKGQYGYDVLATAYNLDLIGLEKGKMNAHAPMRRGVMAQALVNGFKLQGKSELPFTDISPSYDQYKNIETIYHHRITVGSTPTLYKPYDPVTRGQFTSFIMQSLNNSSK